MRAIIRLLESTRLYLLVFTLPPALVWFGFAGNADAGIGAAGILLVAAHALLVLFHVTSFDASTLAWGASPRLGMTGDREHWEPGLVDRVRMVYAALTGLIVAVLFFAAIFSPVSFWWVLLVLGALILVGVLTGGADRPSRRWRMMFAEVLWPGLMLIVPLVLAGWLLGDGDVGRRSPAVTGVSSLLLAGYVVLCLLRDEALDFGEGQRTLATVLGRGGAAVVLFLLLCTLLVVTSRGTEFGWWGWPVAAVSGVAGLAAMWGLAARDGEGMVGIWVLGSAVVGVGMLWA